MALVHPLAHLSILHGRTQWLRAPVSYHTQPMAMTRIPSALMAEWEVGNKMENAAHGGFWIKHQSAQQGEHPALLRPATSHLTGTPVTENRALTTCWELRVQQPLT